MQLYTIKSFYATLRYFAQSYGPLRHSAPPLTTRESQVASLVKFHPVV